MVRCWTDGVGDYRAKWLLLGKLAGWSWLVAVNVESSCGSERSHLGGIWCWQRVHEWKVGLIVWQGYGCVGRG